VFHVQPENGHYQAPKHAAVPYVQNTLYSTTKNSCVRQVYTLYISYVATCFGLTEAFFRLPLKIINPLNTELNHICHLLTLLGAHQILHVSRVRVKHVINNNLK